MTPIETDGAAIVRLRDQLGLTQEDLARRAEVTVRTVARLEKNTCYPRPSTLTAIADALGCSVTDLLAADEAAL